MVTNFYKVFFWKNYLFLKFSWLSTSIICIACFCIFFIYAQSTSNIITTPTRIYERKNIETLKSYFPGNDNDLIFYSPINEFIEDLVERVRIDLGIPIERIKSFNNASLMIVALENEQMYNCFGIHFLKWPIIESGGSLEYSISSSASNVLPKRHHVNDVDINGIIDDDEYTRTGFLPLQHVIDLNFIRIATKKNYGPEVDISPLPSVGFDASDGQRVNNIGALFAVLFNILLLSIELIPLVEEKHDGIKEFLVLATPYNFLNGLTFFCVRFLAYLPFIIGCIIIASVYDALGLVPLAYFFIFFILYCTAAMCYTFLISVCFNSVFYAKVGGFLLLIVPYVFLFVEGKVSNIATILFSTTTFLKGINILQIFTNKHRHFSAADLFVHISSGKPNMFSIFSILLFQILFYVVLYNYLSRIFPGKGGLKQDPLFFLKASFYKKKNQNQFMGNSGGSEDTAITICDLVKTYNTRGRKRKVADHLNMEIRDRRITVLLGHNGAGKTTTLNMIIGCVPKDSGKIIVCSERDVSTYRHLIGFCPQHSVFMQYMTCYEHLQFFAQLRGKTVEEADSLASNLLTQLRLVDKANEPGKNLSGGMKRRLSLGIALSGETKVVILDEPSSGLDIESRRELWDILLELRKSKAILITTHHMEEAEVLGDSISILSNGKLQQTGSPLELKRKYGSGYILKLRTDGNFREQETLNVIRENISEAKIMNTVPPTVLISLPYKYKDKYVKTLEQLESTKDELGISSIAVTDTSLEDVFLNSKTFDEVDSPLRGEETINVAYKKLLPNPIKWTQHMQAIFYKKLTFVQSQWIYSLVMFSLPFFAIAIAIFVMNSSAAVSCLGGMKIDLKLLEEGYIFLKVNPRFGAISDALISEIESNGIQIRNLSGTLTLEEELLSIQSKNLYDFYEYAIGAIVVESNGENPTFRTLYSNNIIHSSVIMMNLIDNTILKFLGGTNDSIEATYFPIHRVTDINPSSLEYFAAIVPIGFFFYILYYVSLPFLENKSNFKTLQAMPVRTYWLSSVAFDIVLHAIICIACYIFQYAIMPSNLYSNDFQALLGFTYFFYGISYLPLLYCMTLGFRSISPLSTYLFFMFIISCIIPFITSDNVQSMQNFATTIGIMSILPDFSLNHQLRVINENFLFRRREKLMESLSRLSNADQDQPNSFTFFVYAVVLFVSLMLFLINVWDDNKRRERLKQLMWCTNLRKKRQLNQILEEEDEQFVRKEKEDVDEIFRSNTEDLYPLIVKDMHRFYQRKHAVRGINFAVKRQECFGLLGVNGAGKTSTFQMITANLPLSGGLIMIDGISIIKEETLYKYHFGYCPQGHCLNNFMTSYQILKFMALVRNIPAEDVHIEVKYWLSQLNLTKYENVPIRYYSGGTKRKLNAAIAMIGNPSLVLLDEPTTGVDPISRRFLWKCIQDFQKLGKTVVLTSHSMDECEHLCNRLAIMANGKLQCIGNIQDLKDRFGSGFTINIKLLSNSSNNISRTTAALQEEFSCELREQHAGMLTYFIKDMSMKWSEVFRRTERFMESCGTIVQDYSINETTLEDIFLKFDRKKHNNPNRCGNDIT